MSSTLPVLLGDFSRHIDVTLLASFGPIDRQQILDLLNSLLPNRNLIVERSTLLSGLVDFSYSQARVPFATLSLLLTHFPRSWPIFELIQTHTTLWKRLPEIAKAGHDADLNPLIQHVAAQVNKTYSSLLDLIPTTTQPAIREAQGTRLSHLKLSQFLAAFRIPGVPSPSTCSTRPIVGIALPNGPTLAVAVLAVASYTTATPINATSGADQFRADVVQGGAKAVMVLPGDVDRLGLRDAWVREHGIRVVLVEPQPDLTFEMHLLDEPARPPSGEQWTPSSPDDIAIILFTSGTSGTKKLVPLTVASIVAGVAFVIDSWGLGPTDVCLNQMPLNHVGGIVRNLFAPVMAGGSTVCCSAFDPNLFWDIVEDQRPTWYYASPSMHSMILDAAQFRPEARARCEMRLVCNAAGGLLPSLAVSLRDTFGCTVLPSYGMTECMPISTPPLDYVLDRPGTSGISVGPEIAILNGRDKLLGTGSVGRISVRGPPLFPGYLRNGGCDTEVFTADGWFDTGDMGYLDSEGFLFVTGRNKEVINRGGELISPFEVEEAIVISAADPDSPIYGRVSQALAFSVNHDVLQEVVGVALVTPNGATRADLRQLQAAVNSSLQQVKWPVVIVYMDDVPKNNNKVLRIRLAERLGLTEVNDDIPAALRHFEAKCPPANSPLTVKIPSSPCLIDFTWIGVKIREALQDYTIAVHVRADKHDGFAEVLLAPTSGGTGKPSESVVESLRQRIAGQLDGLYHLGRCHALEEPFPRLADGSVNDAAVTKLLAAAMVVDGDFAASANTTEGRVCRIVADILGCPPQTLSSDTDFFYAGGDSLKAGRLLSALRKEFALRLPIDVLFTNPRLGSLASLISDKLDSEAPSPTKSVSIPLPGCKDTNSSTNPLLMLLQLVPLVVLYPMKRALTWTVLVFVLSNTEDWPTTVNIFGRLLNLLVAMAAGRFVTELVSPLIAILFKWIIIGRYQAGIYPMWGSYHTRWWFVQKAIQIGGLGHFKYFNWSRIMYYRMMGACIGRNVTLDPGVTFGEYDLIDIGSGTTLDRCICRPFAAERNTSMYLGPIMIGRNCNVGIASVVAAGSVIPNDTTIGPNSSSWEMAEGNPADANLSRHKAPGANWLLELIFAWPVFLLSRFVAAIPWLAGLYNLVMKRPSEDTDSLAGILNWFAAPHRIAYHYVALIANVAIGPIFLFAFVVLIRCTLDACFGPVKPSTVAKRGVWANWRMLFMQKLMDMSRFRGFVDLFGGHYEMTSIAVRALGGKVGKRVYWPGTGPSIHDFALIDVGNDVVFGSRASLVTSDGDGCDFIRVGDGAMVSDRVVLLPGTTLSEGTVFGSGALARRGKTYEPHSTWVGSKGGEAVDLSKKKMPIPEESMNNSTANLSSLGDTSDDDNNTLRATSDAGSRSNTPSIPPIRTSSMNRVSEDTSRSLDPSSHLPRSTSTTTVNTLVGSQYSLPAMPSPSDGKQDAKKRQSQLLDKKRSSKGASTSSTPFGRAFYDGAANYHVLGQFPIFLYSMFIVIVVGFYWNVSTVSGVQVVAKLVAGEHMHVLNKGEKERGVVLYSVFVGIISGLMTVQAIGALLVVISSKWILMGRRRQGNYNWDTSSYCQRWQLFLKIESIRRHCYDGHGILGLLTGTHYCTMYFRALGATIGKDCSLFSGGLPSLMFTEPDLLTLGDRVSVDDASLVSHINSRGHFNLNPLMVGDRSVLRTGSRLLSGAHMGADTCLLEHTLVMAGDFVEDGATMQGWPAVEFDDTRVPTLKSEAGEV
ncbi:hypothetical protein HKX48_006667 [Thoreauomyces humboldtii]|nr:hypothetical protein HKX48_006667 [Thoreauomyces humboldtii]